MPVFMMIQSIPQFPRALGFVILLSPQYIYLYICMHTCGFHCWLFQAPPGPEHTYSHTTAVDKGIQKFPVWSLGTEAWTDQVVPPVSHRKTVVKWVGMNQVPGYHLCGGPPTLHAHIYGAAVLFLPASPLQPYHWAHLPRAATHAESDDSSKREKLF